MNVFEDLVVELKEENLLESTFIDSRDHFNEHSADDAVLSSEEIDFADEPSAGRISPELEWNSTPEPTDQAAPESSLEHAAEPEPDETAYETPAPEAESHASIGIEGNDEPVGAKKLVSNRDFFKKRTAGEMSSLKMVDAVLSAVEREHLKVVPRTYDDLDAKTALHTFLQMPDDAPDDDQKQAEYKLLHETELWCSALASRDKNISVGHLRVYCETCKPMLSSQAMLAMARFYRNLPYAETVRGKFDFIITRLFSKPMDQDKRELLFKSDAMLGHIKTLYADWSSVPLYSADDDDSNIVLTALSFAELAVEAESAKTFDDLIRSDFFGRLRLFKESIAELFFAPAVTAAAIECNVRIGNIYVDLINQARENMDADSIHQRFSELDDQTVSEAAGRSLGLLDILREREQSDSDDAANLEHHADAFEVDFEHEGETNKATRHSERYSPPVVEVDENSIGNKVKRGIRGINKLVLTFCILAIGLSVGVYVWANYYADAPVSNAGVKTLSFQGTDLREFVKTARLSGDTLYIVAPATFDSLPKDKQTDALRRFYMAGNEKGWNKVNVMNEEGKTIGFASQSRLEVY